MKKSSYVRKPSSFWWIVATFLVKVFYKTRIKIKTKKEQRIKPLDGSLILFNHSSMYDYIALFDALHKKKFHYVCTTYFFRNKKLARLLNALGVIPKEQYKADLKSVLKMRNVINNGGIITLAPEGQITLDGKTQTIIRGTEKLIKTLNVNVYVSIIKGSYLSNTKWAIKKSRGPISVETKLILTKNEVQTMTNEEIYDRIVKELEYNDYDNARDNHLLYKNYHKALGFENIAFYCPKCHEFDSIYTENNKVICNKCGFEVFFFPHESDFMSNKIVKNPQEWYEIEYELMTNLAKDDNFTLEHHGNLEIIESVEIVGTDYINIKMNNKTITLSSDKMNEVIDVDKVLNFTNKMNKYLEIPTVDRQYKIYFDNPREIFKFVLLMKVIKGYK